MKHYTKEFKNEIVKRFLNRETVNRNIHIH